MDQEGTYPARLSYVFVANLSTAYNMPRPAVFHRIPAEIVEENVVDAVARSGDIRTLRSIALACRRLLHAVRHHPFFFHRVRISIADDHCAFLDFVRSHQSALGLAQSLSMMLPDLEFPRPHVTIPISLLLLAPSLSQLNWEWIGSQYALYLPPIHPDILPRIRSHATHITTLNFCSVIFVSAPEFARLLLAFRGLLHLCLKDVDTEMHMVLLDHLKILLSHKPLLSLKASTSHTPFCKH